VDIKRKLSLFFHKLSLAWLSCMIFMVQGNLPALTLSPAGKKLEEYLDGR
jgi:hypothetical protein